MTNLEIIEEKYFFCKRVNTACNLFQLTLCPTVRGNNSVSEGKKTREKSTGKKYGKKNTKKKSVKIYGEKVREKKFVKKSRDFRWRHFQRILRNLQRISLNSVQAP
jgi:ribosomal protein S4